MPRSGHMLAGAPDVVAGPTRQETAWSRLLWLYPGIVCPALFIVLKLFGPELTAAYAAAAAAAIALSVRVRVSPSRRTELLIAAVMVAALIALFAVLYPRVNVHVPGQGSDDDDAYNVGVAALLAGHSPYAARTYLGNVLHQLPGAFVLAMPFVVLGTSALQNLFWLPLYFAVVRHDGGARKWLPLAALVCLGSPVVLQQVATGTGHIANTIYVLLGVWWLTRTRRAAVAGAFWGVALASRPNFLLLVPLVFGWLWRKRGASFALTGIGASAIVGVLLCAPFLSGDAATFGPLEAANRLSRFNDLVPHADLLIPVLMLIASLALAMRVQTRRQLFAAGAVVQAIPVALGTALGYAIWREVDFFYLEYATFAAWFAFMGWAQPD